MKFLMVTHYFDSHRGGIELVADKLSRGLAQRTCEVVWAAANVSAVPAEVTRRRAIPLNTWNIVEDFTGLPFPVPTIGALRQLLSHVRRADVVLLHDCLYLSNIATFLFARAHRVPVIIVQHIGMIPYRSIFLKAIMKLGNAIVTRPMLASAQQVVFISQNTARHFGSVDFSSPPALVFNGVDTEIFHTLMEGETREAIRGQLGLPREGRVALFVGRFVEKKGISTMKRMVQLRPDWTWAFAGWGPLNPRNWNLANVRVFSDLQGVSIAALYRACDLFVLPSGGEGLPLVVQEALASGLRVVCGTETVEADEQMKPFVKGVPIYFDDDERTAREFLLAIDGLLDSGAALENSAAGSHEFAASRYSWNRATDQYLEIASHLALETGDSCVSSKVHDEREPGEV